MAERTDVDPLWEEFHRVVNMSSEELRAWLLTAASGEEGFTPDPDLGVGGLGRRVLHVLGKRKADLTAQDVDTMRDVVDLVESRLADPPPSGARDEEWRHALMSVGHDPLRPTSPEDVTG
ncbi:hypothetical protein HNP84_004008 [Thermocatellispora tengchongensis]|uniref:DUF3140 domain-containing protein n=1 Tax=Thermocatellispora tengchongensis TaxID=1073253 RepID=A0A840P6R5_9ACTN|nr:DUF3140 domain-containing protein [Thermocatellispora tengchongensis]MBB5134276.1 hypothetical protein [Thermocatellispora tengchongensis]